MSALKKPLFTGTATAMTAPYDESGIDYSAMARLIDRQLEQGIRTLVINGTTGEAATLTEEERSSLLRFSVNRCGNNAAVIAGIGGNNTSDAIRSALTAADAGADGVLLTTPYYNKANPEGLRRHFWETAEASPLPLIIYNVPGRTSVACSPELYRELAQHPNINGVKEASGNISLISRTRRLCGDALNIWSGNDDQTLPALSLGAKGVISVASNVVPDRMNAMCRAFFRDRPEEARRIHEELSELFEQLFSEVNPIPVKTALHLMGLAPLCFRLPLAGMSPQNKSALLGCLRRLGLANKDK